MRKKRIVVVDDIELQRELSKKVLTKEGYEVITLSSGEDCITFLRENYADLIVLDIMMDGVSGIGVLKHIRQKHKRIELPVIMVTGMDHEEDIVEAFKEGANDYISKPANWAVALARIETQLSLTDYHHESLKLKELEALNALIVTYNHEINGALSVISIDVNKAFKEDPSFERTKLATDRISNLLRKIEKVTSESIEYDEYVEEHQMISLKKKG